MLCMALRLAWSGSRSPPAWPAPCSLSSLSSPCPVSPWTEIKGGVGTLAHSGSWALGYELLQAWTRVGWVVRSSQLWMHCKDGINRISKQSQHGRDREVKGSLRVSAQRLDM